MSEPNSGTSGDCAFDAASVSLQPVPAPSTPNGSTTVTERLRHPRDPNRYIDGTVAPANELAVTHGRSRRRSLPELSPLYGEWAADLGGEGELSAAQRATLRRTVDAYEIAGSAIDYLQRARGSLTNERNQKAVAVFNAATDRLFRGVSLLGLERRAKRLPSPLEWMKQQGAEGGKP